MPCRLVTGARAQARAGNIAWVRWLAGWSPALGRKPGQGTLHGYDSLPVGHRRSGASPGRERGLSPPPSPHVQGLPPSTDVVTYGFPPSLTGLGNDQLSASEQGPSALLTSQLPISQSAQGLRDSSKQDTSGRYWYVLAIRRARVVAWVHGALAEFIHPPSDSASPSRLASLETHGPPRSHPLKDLDHMVMVE